MDLIAKKPVHINGGWVQPGQPVEYGVAGFDYESAARRGLIESVDGDEIENPATPADPATSNAASGAADTLKEQHEAALKAEQDRAAEWQRRADEQGMKVTDLTRQVEQLTRQVQEAQANATRPEDVAALTEYREHVGELLPHDYPERKLLLSLGYLTTLQVEQTDDATLEAEKGLGEKKVEAIRKVTPYKAQG